MRDVMEGFKETRNSKTLGSFSISKGSPVEPWHSTPLKKNLFAANEAPDFSSTKLRDENRTRPARLSLHDLSEPMSSFSLTQDFQIPVNGLEVSTIKRQRLELQLLIAELKDRDQELNTMAAAHHKQLLSWEQDRQRVLILEQRCARLEDELEKRNELIRALSKKTKVAESREKDLYRELNSTQQQLHELSCTQMNTTRHEQDMEERNQSLNSTVMMLSSQVGQLQVREEELSSMLKLKDKDMIEATNHILELSGRLCELEKSLEQLRTRESKTLQEMEEHKHRFRESRHKNAQLKDIQYTFSEPSSQSDPDRGPGDMDSDSRSSTSQQQRRRRRSSDPEYFRVLQPEDDPRECKKRHKSDSFSLTFDDSLSWCVIGGLHRERGNSESSEAQSNSDVGISHSEGSEESEDSEAESDNFSVEFEVESINSDAYSEHDEDSLPGENEEYEVTTFAEDEDSFDEDTEITEAVCGSSQEETPELERYKSLEACLPATCLEPCVICQSRPKNGCIIHGRTGHLMACYTCAKKLKNRNKLCPVCREPIQSVVLTYMS